MPQDHICLRELYLFRPGNKHNAGAVDTALAAINLVADDVTMTAVGGELRAPLKV